MARPEYREQVGTPNKESLSPERLSKDNLSPAAFKNRARWDDAHERGELPLILNCADARVISSETAFCITSIAAGGITEVHSSLLHAANGIKIVTHYDGTTVEPGVRPRGCGGQDERWNLNQAEEFEIDDHSHDAYGFVHDAVAHEDPIINACIQAQRISNMTDVPVVAVAQDHITGRNSLIGVYTDCGNKSHSAINKSVIEQVMATGQYDPRRVYEDGMPSLSMEDAPDFFLTLERDREVVLRAYQEYFGGEEDFAASQKVQRPHSLLITTDPRPAAVKYPDTFGTPNSVFAVRGPRMYHPDTGLTIEQEAIRRIIQQINYPVMIAIRNKGQDGMPFSSMNNILIETRHPAATRAIVDSITEQPWMQDYLAQKDTQILAGVFDQGVLQECDVVR